MRHYDVDPTRWKRRQHTGATTPFSPSFVDHGRLKDTGPTWSATAVANREARVRREKVSASVVRRWMVRG